MPAQAAQWGFSPLHCQQLTTPSAVLKHKLSLHFPSLSICTCNYHARASARETGLASSTVPEQDEIWINVPSTGLGSLSKRWKSRHYSLIFSPTRITLMLEGRPYLKSAAWGCKWTVMYLRMTAFCQGKHPEEWEAARWLYYQSLHLCPHFGCLSCYNERPLDDSTQYKEYIQNKSVLWHSGANLGRSSLDAVGYLLIYLASKRLSNWLQTFVKNQNLHLSPCLSNRVLSVLEHDTGH